MMDAKKSSEFGVRSSKLEDLPLNSNLLEYYTGATRFSWFLIKGDCAPRTAINGNRFDTLSRD